MTYRSTMMLEADQVPENPMLVPEMVDRWASEGGVVVPWSGGLDSTTALLWAAERYENVIAMGVVGGQPWDGAERRARNFWPDDFALQLVYPHIRFVERDIKPATITYDHIHPGRNVRIVEAALTVAKDAGWKWAEVWLGWLDGEIAQAGGDKSRRIATHMANAYSPGFPYRIDLPLSQHTKAGLVRWWVDASPLPPVAAAYLYSCFAGGIVPCGQCQACWRTWVGWVASDTDADDLLPWKHRIEYSADGPWAKYVEKYRRAILLERRITGRRAADTMKAITIWKERCDAATP